MTKIKLLYWGQLVAVTLDDPMDEHNLNGMILKRWKLGGRNTIASIERWAKKHNYTLTNVSDGRVWF